MKQVQSTPWGRWNDQSQIDICYMDMSGILQSLEPAPVSLNRTVNAQPYLPPNALFNSNTMTANQQFPQSAFGYTSYTNGNSTTVIPTYGANYIQQRPLPLPRVTQLDGDEDNDRALIRNTSQSFIGGNQSQGSSVKPEPTWTIIGSYKPQNFRSRTRRPRDRTVGVCGKVFNTPVDELMKIIQATSLKDQETYEEDPDEIEKKRFQCTFGDCQQRFPQKTHLDIHMRSHTGEKPFQCRYEGCGSWFTQRGNRHTHEERHTGKRPFECPICQKRFVQRGNLKTHKATHDPNQRFPCKFDNCCKQFSQRGNLKAHTNRFHYETVMEYLSRFSPVTDPNTLSSEDREIWYYMKDLYKDSNKGIKGRGKGRSVQIIPLSPASSTTSSTISTPNSSFSSASSVSSFSSRAADSQDYKHYQLDHGSEKSNHGLLLPVINSLVAVPASFPNNLGMVMGSKDGLQGDNNERFFHADTNSNISNSSFENQSSSAMHYSGKYQSQGLAFGDRSY